ncbi:helix-turn-helix domain-containing protein [Microbacterium trichothecenolyticum]|uniref:helix-turn-helix domain-containing protein n=1 Tax=Microbacterium trichothecenolyticum TaxID=69370 RepID=UPI003CCB83F9
MKASHAAKAPGVDIHRRDQLQPNGQIRRQMMFRLEILRTFVAVVREGSIIAASRRCGYSAAAVSRQMTALQGRLGITLFQPDGRGIRCTAEARELAEAAQRLLDESSRFHDLAWRLSATSLLEDASSRLTTGQRTS